MADCALKNLHFFSFGFSLFILQLSFLIKINSFNLLDYIRISLESGSKESEIDIFTSVNHPD